MKLKDLLRETKRHRPLAIIIKGNLKRIASANMSKPADAFYNKIKDILEKQGYRVEFDLGLPETTPSQSADLWIGHSRGADRLQFAEGPRTIKLLTKDNFDELLKKYDFETAADLNTRDPRHYMLSDKDLTAICSASTTRNY